MPIQSTTTLLSFQIHGMCEKILLFSCFFCRLSCFLSSLLGSVAIGCNDKVFKQQSINVDYSKCHWIVSLQLQLCQQCHCIINYTICCLFTAILSLLVFAFFLCLGFLHFSVPVFRMIDIDLLTAISTSSVGSMPLSYPCLFQIVCNPAC